MARKAGWVASLLLLGAATGFTVAATDEEREFLDYYWRLPIPAQGLPPAHYTQLERSLAPESCGTCHPAQFADWTSSLHASSIGPGITGQLVETVRTDPATARLCLTCHAPLTEQHPGRARGDRWVTNPDFDGRLQRQGIVCAACHVRRHSRFGPPKRDDPAAVMDRGRPAHDGVARVSAFVKSEFCSVCHQFGPDGLSLNGKPLENTYDEWRSSPAAHRGLQCQDCHMPDRRHLWRGIHSPEMVRSGIELTIASDRSRYRPGDAVQATIRLASVGVGHYFPTYVTPQVILRAALIDAAGREIPGSRREHRIARDVTLDLSREIVDTRIAPGQHVELSYRERLDHRAVLLRATVTVYPDHFYTRFFESLLESGAGAGAPEIRRALRATRRSPFDALQRELPLN